MRRVLVEQPTNERFNLKFVRLKVYCRQSNKRYINPVVTRLLYQIAPTRIQPCIANTIREPNFPWVVGFYVVN